MTTQITILDLPGAVSLTGTESFPVVQGNQTKRATTAMLSSIAALPSIDNGTVLGNTTGGGVAEQTTVTEVLDVIGSTHGQILFRAASSWVALNPGTAGQVLSTQGVGQNPTWSAITASAAGSSGQLQFNSAGLLDASASLSFSGSTLTVGSPATTTGCVALTGSSSGTISIQGQSSAGTYNFNLPTSAGTSGQPLLSGGGGASAMTFGTLGVAAGGTGLTSGTSGGILAFTASGSLESSGALTSGSLVLGGGAGAAPTTSANFTTSGGTLTLGVAASVLGALALAGSTSGTTTIQPNVSASGTLTLPAATDTLVGRNTTDTLTNKTLTAPTLTTPSLGVATATSINKVALTAPATGSTLTIADGKTLTASNTLTFTGTDSTSFAFPSVSDTVSCLATAQTFTRAQTITPAAGVALTLNQVVGSSGLVISGGTQTASTPTVNISQTWNAGGVAFTCLALDVTNTASASGSLLMNLQVGSSSRFKVDKEGAVTLGANSIILSDSSAGGTGAIVLGDATTSCGSGANYALAIGSNASAGYYGSVCVGKSSTAGGDYSIAIGWNASGNTNNGSNSESIAIGHNATIGFNVGFGIAIGSGSTTTAQYQFVAGGTTYYTSNVYFGKGVRDAAPIAYTINGTGGSGTNVGGGDLELAGGIATGNASGGMILFKTSNAGSSGSSAQSLTTKIAITAAGRLGIGTTSPSVSLDVNASAIRVRSSATPASAVATGDAGQICWDSSYIYVCVATDTWKRAALSTW